MKIPFVRVTSDQSVTDLCLPLTATKVAINKFLVSSGILLNLHRAITVKGVKPPRAA